MAASSTVGGFPFIEIGRSYLFFHDVGTKGTVLKDLGNGWILVKDNDPPFPGLDRPLFLNLNVCSRIS